MQAQTQIYPAARAAIAARAATLARRRARPCSCHPCHFAAATPKLATWKRAEGAGAAHGARMTPDGAATLEALRRTLQQVARGPAPSTGVSQDEAIARDGLAAAVAALPPRALVTRSALARLKAQHAQIYAAAPGLPGQASASAVDPGAQKPPTAPHGT